MTSLHDALLDPATYPPGPPDPLPELRETHLSLVGLYGDTVYKLKKPVDLGFVDFTSLEARRQACRDEVRLNRRLAPEVYEGVVPLTRDAGGALHLEGDGELVDWAVKMHRLPDDWRLSERLEGVEPGTMAALGRHIARFHGRASRGARISEFASLEAVSRLVRENFEQTREHRGVTVHPGVWQRLCQRSEALLGSLGPLIARRAAGDVVCETHGDLRLEHVYLEPSGTFIVLDAIEFSERYRHADPVSDVAFLAMELHLVGRADLAAAFCDAWRYEAGDADGPTLLPFYMGYRAIVRAKVEGMRALQQAEDTAEGEQAMRRARRRWSLALGLLEPCARRPMLLLVGGLPGTGKSTLARGLSEAVGASVIRSDVVRKRLAGLRPEQSGKDAFGEGIYDPDWTARTYEAVRAEARAGLLRGERVIVDASFSSDAERRLTMELGQELVVPTWFVHITVPDAVAEARIHGRTGDASDADVAVYRRAREAWENKSDPVRARTLLVDGDQPAARLVRDVQHTLAARGLAEHLD